MRHELDVIAQKLARREAVVLLEVFVEMTLVGEACCSGGIRDRGIFSKEPSRAGNAAGELVGVRRHAGLGAKAAQEMPAAKACERGHFGNGKRLAGISDETRNDCPRRCGSGALVRRGAGGGGVRGDCRGQPRQSRSVAWSEGVMRGAQKCPCASARTGGIEAKHGDGAFGGNCQTMDFMRAHDKTFAFAQDALAWKRK